MLLKAGVRKIILSNNIDISAFPQVQGYLVEEIFFSLAAKEKY